MKASPIPVSIRGALLGFVILPLCSARAEAAPPVLTCGGPYSTVAGSPVSCMITAIDPDGDPIVYGAVNIPPGSTFDVARGRFKWTTTTAQAGDYTARFSATAGGQAVFCDVLIHVTPPVVSDQGPTISCPGSQSGTVGFPISFTVSGSDPDGDSLTFSATGVPPGANFTPATRTFAWNPGVNQSGVWNVTFLVRSGPYTTSCTVAITIAAVDRAPVLMCPGTQFGSPHGTLEFFLTVTDPDGETVTMQALNLPAGATFANTSFGQWRFRWAPQPSDVGSYAVTFRASDGVLASECTVPVEISANGSPPNIMCPLSKIGSEGQLLAFAVSATDADLDPIVFVLDNPPAGASLNSTSGQFTWTPTFEQAGSYLLHFSASDGGAASFCDVPVTIQNVPRPPVVTCPANARGPEGTFFNLLIQAADSDNDPLAFVFVGLPPGATFNTQTMRLRWLARFNQAGTYPIGVQVTAGGQSAACTFTIVVDDAPDTYTPAITAVPDVKNDQGGWVRLLVHAGAADANYGDLPISGYNVWRRIEGVQFAKSPPKQTAASALANGTLDAAAAASAGFPAGSWESVGFTSALGLADYVLLAPTRSDSSGAGIAREVFVVSAHTTEPNTFFVSAPDSGYSVDNLPPSSPGIPLVEAAGAERVRITWSAVPDLDVAAYRIYRAGSADVPLDAAHLIATTPDTAYVDAAGVSQSYRVTALDSHGNESGASPAAGASTVPPQRLAIQSVWPNPSALGARALLALPAAGRVRVVLFDVAGRRVRGVFDETRPAGLCTIEWDGRDDRGRLVPAGAYWFRLESANARATARISIRR